MQLSSAVKDASELIVGLTCLDVEQRFDVQRALDHSWLKSEVAPTAPPMSPYTARVVASVMQTEIEVVVKTLSGNSIRLNVKPTDSIATVKSMIFDTQGLAVETLTLTFAGVKLIDNLTLSSCGVKNGSTLHLTVNLGHLIGAIEDRRHALQAENEDLQRRLHDQALHSRAPHDPSYLPPARSPRETGASASGRGPAPGEVPPLGQALVSAPVEVPPPGQVLGPAPGELPPPGQALGSAPVELPPPVGLLGHRAGEPAAEANGRGTLVDPADVLLENAALAAQNAVLQHLVHLTDGLGTPLELTVTEPSGGAAGPSLTPTSGRLLVQIIRCPFPP